jgi:hypothetical protein
MLAAASLLLLITGGAPAMAYEEPRYEVEQRFETFEVRRYSPQLLAGTRVKGEFKQVGSVAFRRLAGFIFGKNRSRTEPGESEKIAMTAPVTQIPVGDTDAGNTYDLFFMMPSDYAREALPVPQDERVQISQVGERRLAALRFSGTWREANYAEHEAELLEAVREAGLEAMGAPIFARYDPPFMPWFLRRNEVLIEIRQPAPSQASVAPSGAHVVSVGDES